MTIETKRDVFNEVRRVASQDETLLRTAKFHVLLKQDDEWQSRYKTALPDDLPVIPKRISKIIRILKSIKMDITQALMYIRSELNSYTDWSLLDNNSEIFARAWVLGVWRVEETGEIVKLEAEK